MKVYVTGFNKRLLEDKNSENKVMLHFKVDCPMLANNYTEIQEVVLPFSLTAKLAYTPFHYEKKTIACCSRCSRMQFPEIITMAMDEDQLLQERQMKEKAIELAKRRLGL